MKTIFKYKEFPTSNEDIYLSFMEIKSIIDTVREEKGLDESHDLSLASNHLDSFLNALESQIKINEVVYDQYNLEQFFEGNEE